MSRARNIKPGFFTNDLIAEMSPWSRLLFIGLWTMADREGRLHNRPKKIKMEIFPGDNIEVEPLILELVSYGFVSTYKADGIDVLEVVNFTKHQNPHPKEKASELPAKTLETAGNPEKDGVNRVGINGSHVITRPVPENNKRSGLIPSSLIPDSPSLNPSPSQPRETEDDVPTGRTLSTKQQGLFDRWYDVYPKKRGRLDAERAWSRMKPKPTEDFVTVMVAKVLEWKGSAEWSRNGGQYIPNPSTWLNQGRWSDGSPPAPPLRSDVVRDFPQRATPQDRTNAAFDAFYDELDGLAPYDEHEVIDVKVSGS